MWWRVLSSSQADICARLGGKAEHEPGSQLRGLGFRVEGFRA